jgi:ribonuclease E
VIDFIDMASRKHAQQVEEKLRLATKADKARIQLARISRFGLLEMSRQRLHPSVRETTSEVCPRCTGRGHVLTVESMALQMLTRMEDLAEAGKKPTLVVQVPSDTGEYLMNNKRANIARIEENYDVQITLQIRPDLVSPHYRIERQWNENNQQRIEVLEDTSKGKKPARSGRKLKPSKPVVGIPPAPDKKATKRKSGKGWWALLIEAIIGNGKKKKEEEERKQRSGSRNRRGGGRRGQGGGQRSRQQQPRGGKSRHSADEKGVEQGDEKKGRSRRSRSRRRNRPDGDVQQPKSEDKQLGSAQDQAEDNSGEKKPEGQRRRRRRRRKPSGERPENRQNVQASEGDASTAGGEKRPEPASKPEASAASENSSAASEPS